MYQWTLSLPSWVEPWVRDQKNHMAFDTDKKRMQFVIALSKENVTRQTGGPFAAAIFEQASGKLISVGVNCVVSENCSVAHAEIMAFFAAQKKLKTFDLSQKGSPAYQLITSSQMCAMCCGALVWSGVRFVTYGATSKDVEEIVGFDEGGPPILIGFMSWKNVVSTCNKKSLEKKLVMFFVFIKN